MRVLHAAAEFHPVVRTGGLGDVLAALPQAEARQGAEVRVLLPGYPAVLAALAKPRQVASLGPLFGATGVGVVAGRLGTQRLTVYAIDAPDLYARPGNPYLGPDGAEWPDNAARFGLLGRIAAALSRGEIDPEFHADILHVHDWHAALGPAYLKLLPGPEPIPASVLTIHNLAFQGLFPPAALDVLGLPRAEFRPDGFEFWGQISFMKAGLVYADRVTTVSPGYAAEIRAPEFGCGLEGVLAARGEAVSGILNGVDDTIWNPASDPALAQNFSAREIARRGVNRIALLAEFGLEDHGGPLYGVVSRLSPQKGLDLVLAALPALLAGGGSLALLGAGDADLEQGFLAAAAAFPGRVAVAIDYDDGMAHRIFAGADAVLVPSRFEPCGLTQLYALRYGAVPVVRRTGGLGDTVVDATAAALGDGSATGVVFDAATPEALAAALERTAALFRDRPTWLRLQRAGLGRRFTWSGPARAYLELYAAIRAAP
jgi:starch synthase